MRKIIVLKIKVKRGDFKKIGVGGKREEIKSYKKKK